MSWRSTLTVSEAAFVLGCSKRDLRNMVRRGDFRNVGAGRSRRIDPDELAAFVIDSPLRGWALDALMSGTIVAPQTRDPSRAPPGIDNVIRDLLGGR